MTSVDGYEDSTNYCSRYVLGYNCERKCCHKKTYDNEETIKKMVLSQGFQMKDRELPTTGTYETADESHKSTAHD